MAGWNPSPLSKAYISAKTHMDSFLAAWMVALANTTCSSKRLQACLEYFAKVAN